jgi:uncharacterized membrane protein
MNADHFHPISVHFPIALILVAFVADTINLISKKESCLPKMGYYLQILGTFGAIIAVLTGEFFTEEITGPGAGLRESHELFAYITMYVLIVTSLVRIFLMHGKKEQSKLKWLNYGLLIIAVITIGITGFKGGSIVYDIWLSGTLH